MSRLPVRASDSDYETWARTEVTRWQAAMLRPAGSFARIARRLQTRINGIIPDKVHAAVTLVIQGLTRTILTGSNLTTAAPLQGLSLAERDARARELIGRYRAISAVEGGVTGAGGFWLALADFPALLVLKIKLLFDLAAVYGHDTTRFEERLYILELFQLAFSAADHRAAVFQSMLDWDGREQARDFAQFDWRRFQQEYRDHIDLAKLAQMIPIVGAPIGAVVNWRLLERLGRTAMNGYRMRYLAQRDSGGVAILPPERRG